MAWCPYQGQLVEVKIGTRTEAKTISSFKLFIVRGCEYIRRLNRARDMLLEFMDVGSECRRASSFSQDGLKRWVSMVSKLNLWFPTGQHEKQSSLPGTLSTKDGITWHRGRRVMDQAYSGFARRSAGWSQTDMSTFFMGRGGVCATYFLTICGIWNDLLDSYKS
jgi:hypothetical protein